MILIKHTAWALIVLLLLVAGGTSYESNKQTITPYMKQLPFSVTIEAAETIGINEELSVTAVIKNITDQAYVIQHGITIFQFFVFDDNGRQINTFKRAAVMKDTIVEGSGAVEEKFNYRFQGPGIFYVEAVAIISVSDGEPFPLKTDKMKVTVK